jgi:rhomboid family GlyGly-CTERM serine protease
VIRFVTRPGWAWVGVAALLACCALLGRSLAHESIDWQGALAFTQPWRAFTAVGVHYSVQHFVGNLAGLALTGVFGLVAHVPARIALAWLAAWPLTHVALFVKPELAHYGGLSGVLHAGAAAVITYLLINGTAAQRWVGCAVLLGLCAKLLSESPWGPALRYPPGWDIAIAPIVHATGSIAGAGCAVIALMLPQSLNGTRPSSNNDR